MTSLKIKLHGTPHHQKVQLRKATLRYFTNLNDSKRLKQPYCTSSRLLATKRATLSGARSVVLHLLQDIHLLSLFPGQNTKLA